MTTARRLSGILAPVTTPFAHRTGEIDQAAFQSNLTAHLRAGLDGIVVAGSNGEGPLLDDAERFQLVEYARAVVPGDRWLLAGTGAESTRAAVRLARGAAERGADAVLVSGPHYYGAAAMTAEALIAHYRRLADESPVPVVLYNIPKYMHYTLAPQLVHDLATHGNISGIKDSSGDVALVSTYLSARTQQFSVLLGSAQLLTEGVHMGADGGILAVSMFAPRLTLDVYAAARRGEPARSAQQAQLGVLGRDIVGVMGVAGVKTALDLIGLHGGDPRLPLLPAGHEATMHVRTLLHEAGVLGG